MKFPGHQAVNLRQGINFSSGVLVKSYLGFGMTHIQKKAWGSEGVEQASVLRHCTW